MIKIKQYAKWISRIFGSWWPLVLYPIVVLLLDTRGFVHLLAAGLILLYILISKGLLSSSDAANNIIDHFVYWWDDRP